EWLNDHAVEGVAILPGTGFAELVWRAADEAGCEHIEELTLSTPAVVASGGAAVHVLVGAPDEDGRRGVTVATRRAGGDWTPNAEALVSPQAPADRATPPAMEAWPPADAQPVDVEDFYPAAAEVGYGYGPAFNGLRSARTRPGEVFAEIALPDGFRDQADDYALHPALFDAVLHAAGYLDPAGSGALRLPFVWTDLALHATGASDLRVHVSVDDPAEADTASADADSDLRVTLTAYDADGAPVVSAA